MDKKIAFNELPDDIKKTFLVKTALSVCLTILFLSAGIVSKHTELNLVCVFFMAMMISQMYVIKKFMNNKYRRFTGICIQVKKPEYNIGTQAFKIAHIYGYSRAILQIDDYQVQIPISNGLDIAEADEVSFYAEKDDFQATSETYFVVENPKCIKIEKVKAA